MRLSYEDARGLRLLLLIREVPPGTAALILGLLLASGIAEGIGLATFLPLFSAFAADTGGASDGPAAAALSWIRDFTGFTPGVGLMLITVVVLFWFKAALVVAARAQIGASSARFATGLRTELVESLARAQWDYFKRKPVGDLANAMTTEITKASAAQGQAFDMTASLMQIAVYLTVALLISWQLTLGAMVVSGLAWFPLQYFVSMGRRAGKMQRDSYNTVIRDLVDHLVGVKAIKAMAAEDRFTPMLTGENKSLYRGLRLLVLSNAFVQGLAEPILVTLMAGICFAAFFVIGTDLASLLVVAMALYRMTATVLKLQTQNQGLASNEPFVRAVIRELTDAHAAREVRPGGKRPVFDRAIAVRNLSFAFGDRQVLRRVNLDIPAGEITVLHGMSGSGKTTLVDLITGLYEPAEGVITVDGVPLPECDLTAWRHQIGYVPQELLLFNASVLANVTLRDPGLTEEAAVTALRDAGAWDFVAAMPNGIYTTVGERAQSISGGQRQRLAIARALVRKPRLLILDEPTTALDAESEARICQTLKELARGVAVFAVSHQPAVLAIADRAYRIVAGGVVLEGDSERRPLPFAASE